MKTLSESPTAFDPNAYLHFKCPLCDSVMERRKVASAGTYVKGALGAALAPFLVGFFLINNALKTRREVYRCPTCGRTT